MKTALITLCLSVIAFDLALAGSGPVHAPSASMRQQMEEHNARLDPRVFTWGEAQSVVRPFSEYESARYFLTTHHDYFGAAPTKVEMVRQLPETVTAVILVDEASEVAPTTERFAKVIDKSRLKVVHIQGGAGFWARDSLPLPVFTRDSKSGALRLALVDARYHQQKEPDSQISAFFGVGLLKHDYYFEGGNFMADSAGNCATIDRNIPTEIFKSLYGCKTTTRLPRLKGIGHIDESAKFLSDKIVVTDLPEYAATFSALGYSVSMLPRPMASFGTYVNSLLVNGTLYLPVYGEKTDAEAIRVYTELGFKVVPLNSKDLSENGMGSLHCITMTYPDNLTI